MSMSEQEKERILEEINDLHDEEEIVKYILRQCREQCIIIEEDEEDLREMEEQELMDLIADHIHPELHDKLHSDSQQAKQ